MAYNLLKGKKGLIFGEHSTSSRSHGKWRNAPLKKGRNRPTNTAVSIRMGTIGRLAEKCNTIVVPADATSVEDLENLIDKTMEHFGGKFDFMLHSIGMSPNVRRGAHTTTWITITSPRRSTFRRSQFHKAIQVARKKRTPSTTGGRSWRSRISRHSVRSTVITTWPMPRRCWSRSPAVSGISTAVRSTCASTPCRSRRRRPRPEVACWGWAT